MHISKLYIRNFRNFDNVVFHFGPGTNTIIGENGSGKTNAFHAIRIMLDDSLPSRQRFLEESDFNRALGSWPGHWVVISIEFSNLDASESAQALTVHSVENPAEETIGRFTYIFRPAKAFRQKLFELSEDPEKTPQRLRELLNTLTTDDYEYVFLCRGTANFSADEQYVRYVGDFQNIQFPDPEDQLFNELGVPQPQYLNFSKEVACTFVKALRDVVSDLRYQRKSPLLTLLRDKKSEIETGEAEEISGRIRDLNHQIATLDEISDISKRIRDTLDNTIGNTYAPNIEIKSELPDDLENLLKSLTLWVGDPNSQAYTGKVEELSLGGANLIFLSLKLLEYEVKRSRGKVAHFLLIEEPEAHIHPHIQRTLFSKVPFNSTQVIFSTHSTQISDVSKISAMNILSMRDQRTKVFFPGDGIEDPKLKRIERYLDATRSALLFSKGVILVEGDAELILIPALVKNTFGLELDEMGISLINMSSTVFENISELFANGNLEKPCAILTDWDKSPIELPPQENGEPNHIKEFRNSENAGAARKEKLDELCNGQDWIQPFYAEHTFEIDLYLEGNKGLYIDALDDIYTRNHDKQASTEKLNTETSETGGVEALRLANKEGKGWLALLLAEKVKAETRLPSYICKAVSFAAGELKANLLLQLLKYRAIKIDQEFHDGPLVAATTENLQEVYEAFKERHQNDELVTLVENNRVITAWQD